MQNMSCKVDAATLKPAQYPANPELEWWVGAAELLELIEAAPLSCPPLPPCRKAVSCVSAELWMLCQPHTHPVDVCNGRRCPPGHGDIYPSLLGSGMLDRLIAGGLSLVDWADLGPVSAMA